LGLTAAVLAAVGLAEWAGWPFLRAPLERQMQQRLQRDVTIGEHFSLRLIGSIRLATDRLHIGPPQGAQAHPALNAPLLDAQGVRLEVPYGTVRRLMSASTRHEPMHIHLLRFERGQLALKRLADGRSNWSFGPPRPQDREAPLSLPRFDELVLVNGHIVWDDAVTRSAIDAGVRTDEGEQAAGAGAALVVEGRGRYQDQPFDIRAKSAGVLPLMARDASTHVPVSVDIRSADTRFTFEGSGTDLVGLRSLDGQAMVKGASLSHVGDAVGVTLPTTSPFELRGRLSKAGEQWMLRDASLNVGASRLGGSFTYDRGQRVPMLTGQLTGTRLALADLLPAFGAAGAAGAHPHKPPGGRVLPQREFDVPALHGMNAQVKVQLARAELGSIFAQPLSPLDGDLRLNGGVLTLSNLLARSAGGQVQGDIRLDATQSPPRWSADLRWAGINLDQWLAPRDTKAPAEPGGAKPGYIGGRLTGHAQLQSRGTSTSRMIASLEGTVQAWIRNGSISHLVIEGAGIDIAESLGILVTRDEFLPMRCAVLQLRAGDGILVPEVGVIDTGDSTLFVTGSISLAEERLDLTLITKPKDMSPVTLRSPVKVQGTFAQPKVGLDTKQLATKVGLAAVLASIHPLAALVALFDPGEKDEHGGCDRTLQQLHAADGAPAAQARATRQR
jgi:uncharacterized protein involved in outer membrane biogenesis